MELAAAAGEGEDRLSALPDDVVVLILLKLLNTRDAARTRVLSHRWRRIWALLPKLCFPSPPEPHWLRDALDNHNVLLRDLTVLIPRTAGVTPESLAVWLPAAARRVSGQLMLATLYVPVEEEEAEEEAAQRGAFEFPCFDKATKIYFCLQYQGLAVPVTGVFARLTELSLKFVWFHGPGELGDAVSSPRCPCLQKLTIEKARGLRDLAIHSESMQWMKLSNLRTLSQLIIVAPGLKELTMQSCFVRSPPVADISAPLLTRLDWTDKYDPTSVHLGNMPHLQWLRTGFYFARLTELYLKFVWFHGPGELGDAVSSPRCLCLQKLTIEKARGLRDLAIHSESMQWMKLSNLRTLSQLIVVAPGLKELTMEYCFVKNEPVANISALQWGGDLHFNGVVIYTMWNIWKERNRRIFQGMAMDARQVALQAKEDIDMRTRVLNSST